MKTIKNIILMAIYLSGSYAFSLNGDANELLEQIDAALMPESFEAYRKIIDIEPDGNQKEYVVYTIKKGTDSVALLFLSPASDKDRAILRLGDNTWLYIPSVGRPIRQANLQSATGGIFNNSDLLTIDYSEEYNAEILEESDSEYVLNLQAKNKSVAYDSLKLRVNKNGLIITRIECYSASKMLLKTLEFSEIVDFGNGIVRPSIIQTHSPLYEGYRSVMIFGTIEPKEFPNEVFTLDFLPRLGELR